MAELPCGLTLTRREQAPCHGESGFSHAQSLNMGMIAQAHADMAKKKAVLAAE
jgi:hypothetical protein